jgi:hypothetical protein
VTRRVVVGVLFLARLAAALGADEGMVGVGGGQKRSIQGCFHALTAEPTGS